MEEKKKRGESQEERSEVSEPTGIQGKEESDKVSLHLVNYVERLETILQRTRQKLKRERGQFGEVVASMSNYFTEKQLSSKSIEDYLESVNPIAQLEQPIDLRFQNQELLRNLNKQMMKVNSQISKGKQNVIKIGQKKTYKKRQKTEEKEKELGKKKVKTQSPPIMFYQQTPPPPMMPNDFKSLNQADLQNYYKQLQESTMQLMDYQQQQQGPFTFPYQGPAENGTHSPPEQP